MIFMLKKIFWLIVGLAGMVSLSAPAWGAGPALERIPDSKPRNIVFILVDDLRYDAMGFMNHPFLQTPNIDSLAKNGVHLKNAFVTTSLCSPSRASMLTGLYAHRHHVVDNQHPIPKGTVFFSQRSEER